MTALVLIHGFTGTPRAWHAVVERLPSSVVYMPALLGHDGTPGTGAAQSFDEEVDRIAAEVVAAAIPRARLVGYSLGARVALGLLARHAGLFLDATLVGVHPGLDSAAARRERVESDARWRRLLEDQGIRAFVDAWEALPLFASQGALPPRVIAAQRRERLGHNPRGLSRALGVLGLGAMPAYRDALASCELPLRFVAGEHDEKFRRLATELATLTPYARATVIAGAGHNVVLEQPGRLVDLLLVGDTA